jgi:hypothetical protein
LTYPELSGDERDVVAGDVAGPCVAADLLAAS